MKQKEDSKGLLEEQVPSQTPAPAPAGPVYDVLAGSMRQPPPMWLMRQAGRYLPEYRALRAKAGSFLDLCFDPQRASEVTLQPVVRFDLDAAIIFSDILLVPHALGQRVDFVEGEGPRLEPLAATAVRGLDPEGITRRLQPVFDAVGLARSRLAPDKTLIGFCGAPWTVATYMIAGRGTVDQAAARRFVLLNESAFADLIERLVEASVGFLLGQIRAGARVVQIFDTWAGVLGEEAFEQWCVAPTKAIVERLRAAVPEARIIGFPKGAGLRLERYVAATGVDGVSIDWTVPLRFARDRLQPQVAVQGNLDPLILATGGGALDAAIDRILAGLGGGRFVFNLGHGVVPDTPVGNVERLVARVRRWRG